MIKNRVKNLMIPLAVTFIIFLDGCKKDEAITPKFQTNLLIGDWSLTEVDGEDYSDPDYSIIFKFESSGDFGTCIESASYPEYNYCDTNGKWEWKDANQATIIVTQDSDVVNLDIIILDETRLEGNISYDDNDESTAFKFIKIL